MVHYKSHKETTRTFSITFDVENVDDVRKLKAFAIIMGAFNPLKHEGTDVNALYEAKKKANEDCAFENMIYEVQTLLK